MTETLPLHKIKAMLADRKLSVVSDRAGLSKPTIRHVINGGENITQTTIRKLSDYLTGAKSGEVE